MSSTQGGAPPTAGQVAEVRAALLPTSRDRATDADIARYLRAVAGDLQLAVKRLNETYQWREQEGIEDVVCTACLSNSRSHYMHVISLDKLQRPVIYSVFSLAEDKDPEENKKHMIHQFETAVRLMPEGVEKWVWIMDFHGFGFLDCNPKIATIFLNLTSTYYPERLGAIVVIGAPALFNGLWGMLKPLITDVTKEKIRFCPYDVDSASKGQQLRDGLSDIFDEELMEWLLIEMSDNRQAAKKKMKKAYSLTDLENLPPSGEHDARGTASFVKLLSESTHILTGHQKQG